MRGRYARPASPCILGERLGRPELRYVQLDDAAQVKALREAGLSQSFADLYVEMTRAINEGTLRPRRGRTAENTTPTPFEEFAGERAAAYRSL